MIGLANMTAALAQAAPSAAAGGDRSWLAWMLGLERIDPASGDVIFQWKYALPLWAWLVIIAAILWLAWFSYRRMLGRRTGRIVLAVVRGVVLLAVVALLCKPLLVLPDERVEKGHVLMLVDQTESLTVKDVEASDNERITRHKQLLSLIGGHAAMFQRMTTDKSETEPGQIIDWLGFSDRVAPLGDPADLPEPTGQITALRSAIEAALRRAAGKPIAGMVIYSDGRSMQPIDPDIIRRLQQLQVPVWVAPLGSPDPPLDLTLARIDYPEEAFVNDVVPVTVTVDQIGGGAGEDAPPGTTVKLIDSATGELIDEQPVRALGESIRLLHTPKAAGSVEWKLQLVTTAEELIPDNNDEVLELTLTDRPIRVLYVEGYPRWEYRFLKDVLKREKSINSSMMLVSADRLFAQEGDTPLRRLPRTTDEMTEYDVIILGDLEANYLSTDQQKLIYEQVSVNGSGLLMIGGPQFMPNSYATSGLSAMMPIAASQAVTLLPTPIEMKPTKIAEALGVLNLRTPGAVIDEHTHAWPDDLPTFEWAQSLDDLKPAAEVLAIDERSQRPLAVRMRFGAGQTLYLATDETWRWRYGKGELYREQFWMQLIRLLARGRLQSGAGANERARLVVSHRRAATGDTLVVELTLKDQTLLDNPPPSVDAIARPEEAGADESRREMIKLTATADRPGLYRGTFTPNFPGKVRIDLATPELADLDLHRRVVVEQADAEMRYPATNHPLLEELTEKAAGDDAVRGSVLTAENFGELEKQMPNASKRYDTSISEPLTRSPLAFILILALLTFEWIGRKLLGLA